MTQQTRKHKGTKGTTEGGRDRERVRELNKINKLKVGTKANSELMLQRVELRGYNKTEAHCANKANMNQNTEAKRYKTTKLTTEIEEYQTLKTKKVQ